MDAKERAYLRVSLGSLPFANNHVQGAATACPTHALTAARSSLILSMHTARNATTHLTNCPQSPIRSSRTLLHRHPTSGTAPGAPHFACSNLHGRTTAAGSSASRMVSVSLDSA